MAGWFGVPRLLGVRQTEETAGSPAATEGALLCGFGQGESISTYSAAGVAVAGAGDPELLSVRQTEATAGSPAATEGAPSWGFGQGESISADSGVVGAVGELGWGLYETEETGGVVLFGVGSADSISADLEAEAVVAAAGESRVEKETGAVGSVGSGTIEGVSRALTPCERQAFARAR